MEANDAGIVRQAPPATMAFWKENDMKRFGVLLASAALGAAVAASGAAGTGATPTNTRRTGMGAGAGMAGNGLTPAMIMAATIMCSSLYLILQTVPFWRWPVRC